MDNNTNIDNTENIEDANVLEDIKGKPRGQRPKTETEIRTLFAECIQTIGAKGLRLKVETKTSMVKDKETGVESEKKSLRCSVIYVDDDSFKEVIEPVAGNTFSRYLDGALAFGPYIPIR